SVHLPAQVTPAPGHLTGSYAEAPARARAASLTGQDQPVSDGLGHACGELAALIPALIPALSRDSLPPDGRTGLSAGTAANPDAPPGRDEAADCRWPTAGTPPSCRQPRREPALDPVPGDG